MRGLDGCGDLDAIHSCLKHRPCLKLSIEGGRRREDFRASYMHRSSQAGQQQTDHIVNDQGHPNIVIDS